eukprot:503851_1
MQATNTTKAIIARCYILFCFFMVYTMQSNNWFTFSSIPDKVEEYYHLSTPKDNKVNGVIDLLLNWGPICFLPVTPFSAYLLSLPNIGLKWTVHLAATLAFLGAFIRCIPTILVNFNIGNYKITNDLWNTLIFLHIGQILNAIAGPLVMAPPPKLSVIWFPESQRNSATSIAVSAGVFGLCFGFLFGPLINDIEILLYFNLLLTFIPFICVWIYFPIAPKQLPTAAAKNALLSQSMSQICIDKTEMLLHMQQLPTNHKTSFCKHCMHFMYELKEIFFNYSAMIVICVAGGITGIFGGWSGVFQDMLSPVGLNDAAIGFIGFNLNITEFLGGILFGFIADKWFQKQLKSFTIFALLVITLLFMVLLFSLPSPWDNKSKLLYNVGLDEKMIVLNLLIGFIGLISGGVSCLFYELVANISFPVTEGTSSTLLVFGNNLTCLIFVGIGNWINTKWETFLAVIMCVVAVILMVTVRDQYKREKISQ